MWEKVKAACLRSLTIAWSYVLMAVGTALSMIDMFGDALGDPQLRDQISAAIGNTTTTARIFLVLGFITFLARLRSLRRG